MYVNVYVQSLTTLVIYLCRNPLSYCWVLDECVVLGAVRQFCQPCMCTYDWLNFWLDLRGTELRRCCFSFSSTHKVLQRLTPSWWILRSAAVTAPLLSGIMCPTFLYLSYVMVCCAADKLVHPHYTLSMIAFSVAVGSGFSILFNVFIALSCIYTLKKDHTAGEWPCTENEDICSVDVYK